MSTNSSFNFQQPALSTFAMTRLTAKWNLKRVFWRDWPSRWSGPSRTIGSGKQRTEQSDLKVSSTRIYQVIRQAGIKKKQQLNVLLNGNFFGLVLKTDWLLTLWYLEPSEAHCLVLITAFVLVENTALLFLNWLSSDMKFQEFKFISCFLLNYFQKTDLKFLMKNHWPKKARSRRESEPGWNASSISRFTPSGETKPWENSRTIAIPTIISSVSGVNSLLETNKPKG